MKKWVIALLVAVGCPGVGIFLFYRANHESEKKKVFFHLIGDYYDKKDFSLAEKLVAGYVFQPHYTDYNVANATWYYYKLAKRRGEKVFTTNYYGCGVAGNSIEDSCENNDTKERATGFNTTIGIDASIYYYKDGAGNIIQDSDWYSVTVAAETKMTIRFENYRNIDNEGILYKDEFGQPDPLNLNEEKTIINTEPNDKVFYFQILPAEGAFFDENAGGGKIGNYQITWVSTQPIKQ
jgi:hypothetical protein